MENFMSKNVYPEKDTVAALIDTTRHAWLAYLVLRPENDENIDASENKLEAITSAKRLANDSMTKPQDG